jgi:dGTPase
MLNNKCKAILQLVKRKQSDFPLGSYRNEFMRDRDRILYSKPFRRMARKTQVFLPASDDHVRTRLTHTLEVAQISTISAQALNLDRDLTEAIALGHDLGHTPFGHTGERVLHLISSGCDQLGSLNPSGNIKEAGFKHNLQGIRICSETSSLYANFLGLNLSNFTLWGIQNHTGKNWKKCDYSIKNGGTIKCTLAANTSGTCTRERLQGILANPYYDKYNGLMTLHGDNGYPLPAWSLEAQLVSIADEIAQRHHDIEDGLIANIIERSTIFDLINNFLKPYFNLEEKAIFEELPKNINTSITSEISKLIVGCLNRNLIANTVKNILLFQKHYSIKKYSDFKRLYLQLPYNEKFVEDGTQLNISEIVSYEKSLHQDEQLLKEDLKNMILNSYHVQRMDGKARYVVRQLAKAYLSNPQQLPDSCITQLIAATNSSLLLEDLPVSQKRIWINQFYHQQGINNIQNKLVRVICDYISGMTDDFATDEYSKLYAAGEYSHFKNKV